MIMICLASALFWAFFLGYDLAHNKSSAAVEIDALCLAINAAIVASCLRESRPTR